MTQTTQPLESYRLARYAVPIHCLVCNEDNAYDAERCRSCQAPLALTYQCAGKKSAPQLVAVLAPERAGKTVYLGMLTDMLSRQSGNMQLVARGAFSVSLQQAAIGALGAGCFPPATPVDPGGWNWMHCQVSQAGRTRGGVEVVLPDISGQAIGEEIEHPHSRPMLNLLFRKCTAAVILLDASRLVEGDRDPDFYAMKCVSYLYELDSRRRGGWPRRPFAFVFTKADGAESSFQDPAAFCERFAPGLAQQTRQRLSCYKFFAASVASGVAWRQTAKGRVPYPFRIEPRGITQPFEWVLKQLPRS
jgi:hypothetical protein